MLYAPTVTAASTPNANFAAPNFANWRRLLPLLHAHGKWKINKFLQIILIFQILVHSNLCARNLWRRIDGRRTFWWYWRRLPVWGLEEENDGQEIGRESGKEADLKI